MVVLGEKKMFNLLDLEKELKLKKIHSKYILCGNDENSIKDVVKRIKHIVLNKEFQELNYTEIDGANITLGELVNACETLPFMSEKKIVLVYRASYLKDNGDKAEESRFKEIKEYIKNIPEECVLIMYYIFENSREKESIKVKNLNKFAHVFKFEKLKGKSLEKKVEELFAKRKAQISRAEIAILCNLLDNNLDIVENEIEKLCTYAWNRKITRQDIELLVTKKNESDIFNLVDYISQKRPEKALDILDELIFKGELITGILRMIQRQFKLLLSIKIGINQGKSKEILSKQLRLHPYICEKMIAQSKKFTVISIRNAIEKCLDTERILKTSSTNPKIEMELLLISVTTL
jgi:DNA polymerase-3 subunit delta